MPKTLIFSVLFALILSGVSLICIVVISLNSSNWIEKSNNDVLELRDKVHNLNDQIKAIESDLKKKVVKTDETNSTPAPTETATTTTPVQQPVQETVQQPAVQTARVSANSLNLRSEASTIASNIRMLSGGETLTLLGEENAQGGYSWVKVRDSQGNTGWVVKTYITLQ